MIRSSLREKASVLASSRRERPMPFTLRFCKYCGADPRVRAGPPGPAFGTGIHIRPDAKRPTRASAADQGVRPTVNARERRYHNEESGIGLLACRGLLPKPAGPRTLATLVLSLALGSCVPWTVRPIDGEKGAPEGPAAVSPAAYVDSVWAAKLVPAVLNRAVDARTLVDALAASPEDAQARYGRREANGPVYFMVKGDGVVTSVDLRSRGGLALVDVAPFDRLPDLSIQIGPVLRGSSLRDATGIVRFTDFVNQLQFADVGNELNDRVLKTVLASLDKTKLTGRRVSFAGTLAAEPKAEPPLR
jgi:predicted lipoprotein